MRNAIAIDKEYAIDNYILYYRVVSKLKALGE